MTGVPGTPEEALIAEARAEVGEDWRAIAEWLAVVAAAAARHCSGGYVRAEPAAPARPGKPARALADGTEI